MLTPLVVVLAAVAVDPYAPPAGWYDSVSGTGTALEASLHQRVRFPFQSRSYSIAAVALPIIDADPDQPGNVILIYNGQSVDGSWDNGVTWNREHTWPRSRGIDSTGPDNSDQHMLRPCNPSVNSSRGNKPFGIGGAFYDPGVFGQYDRGEIARSMFYAAVRYDGTEPNTTDLTLVSGTPVGSQMGDLDTLLAWHFEEAPDDHERRRNAYVFDSNLSTYAQGNRNPFIDRPEYAWAIWGTGPNDSRLTLLGGNPMADGSSELLVDLGDAVVGSAPPVQNFTLVKTGTTPTTWELEVPGALAGLPASAQSFSFNDQQRTLSVSFASTDAAVLADGVVLINNTDLTSAGVGRGSDDADDAVLVMGRVLDPADAAFDGGALTRSVDVGAVAPGEASGVAAVINAAEFTPGLTADAEVLSVSPPSGMLALDIAAGDLIAAGEAREVRVVADQAAAPGATGGVFTIVLGDDSGVFGAQQRATLTLTVSAVIAPSCVGDVTTGSTNPGDAGYGQPDGVADASDLTYFVEAWVSGSGAADATTAGTNPGDAGFGVPDGSVDAGDLTYFVEAWIAGCA